MNTFNLRRQYFKTITSLLNIVAPNSNAYFVIEQTIDCSDCVHISAVRITIFVYEIGNIINIYIAENIQQTHLYTKNKKIMQKVNWYI